MSIKKINELNKGKIKIDLTGPDGNAFYLIGLVKTYGKQLGFDNEKISSIQDGMMSGDYENLIEIFDSHFGDYIDLYK